MHTSYSFLIFVLHLSTLRRWDYSAAIQELFGFLVIRTKQIELLLRIPDKNLTLPDKNRDSRVSI